MIVCGFDIETTGPFTARHRVIEACFQLYDFDTRELKKNITLRFNPERSIDPSAQEVHGITLEELLDEPKFRERAHVVKRIIDVSDLFVGHNALGFDGPFLEQELRNAGMETKISPVFDTMAEGLWAHPYGKWPRLEELCFALGVEYRKDMAHAADYDVRKTMECFWRGLDIGKYSLIGYVNEEI